jgi:hypothetical protein
MPMARMQARPPSGREIPDSLGRAHHTHRVNAAERAICKWRSTYPPLDRAARERLAALLLAEDDET